MHKEIAVASRWWANQIRASPLAAQSAFLADHFEQSLVDILHAHYAGHWYRHDVLRGSAYRAITYDHRLDSSLRRAGESAGIVWNRLEKLLQQARFVVMFVNPGEVKLSRLSQSAASNYGGGGVVELLYSAPTAEMEALEDALIPLTPMLYACTNGLTVTEVILGNNCNNNNKTSVMAIPSTMANGTASTDAPFAPSTSPPMSSSNNLSPSAPLSPYSPSLADDRDPYRLHRAASAVGVGAGSSIPATSMLAMS